MAEVVEIVGASKNFATTDPVSSRLCHFDSIAVFALHQCLKNFLARDIFDSRGWKRTFFGIGRRVCLAPKSGHARQEAFRRMEIGAAIRSLVLCISLKDPD